MSAPRAEIIDKIKDFQWVLNWSGNWPLLDCDFQLCDEFDKEARELIGIPIVGVEIASTEGETMVIYRAQEDFDSLDNYFKEKFKSDPEFLKRSGAGYRERVDKDLAELRKIRSIRDLNKVSKEELIKIFQHAFSCFHYNAMIDIYDWYMERTFIPELETYLRKRLKELGKEDKVVDYVNILLTPYEKSVTFQERTQFFDIVRYIRNQPELEEKVRRDVTMEELVVESPGLKKKLETYFDQYAWMPVLVNNPPQKKENLWREIKTLVKNNTPLKIESKRLGDIYDPKISKKAEECLSELRPSQEIKSLIEGLRMMAWLRTEDYVVMSESSYCVIPLYEEIGRRLGVTYSQLKNFLHEEIVDFLENEKVITPEQLESRQENCYVSIHGERQLFEGEEAKKIQAFLKNSIRQGRAAEGELKGTVASKGRVRGKVKVALTPEDLKDIKGDEILVVANVSAAFISGMRRVSGIIAEYGGLVSHPVIVAREMNIPCLVAVKGATHLLRDGDLVEVDAESGIVKLLK